MLMPRRRLHAFQESSMSSIEADFLRLATEVDVPGMASVIIRDGRLHGYICCGTRDAQAPALVKKRIRDVTRRTRGISLTRLVEDLTPYLLGWRGYFGFCQTPRVLTNLEAWIRRRLRSYLWR
jgi:Group II intron, maturase-specific domain